MFKTNSSGHNKIWERNYPRIPPWLCACCKFLWSRAILQCPMQIENMATLYHDPSTPISCCYFIGIY